MICAKSTCICRQATHPSCRLLAVTFVRLTRSFSNLRVIHLVIKSVAVGSASVAPEIVPSGTRMFVCVGLHVRVESIVSGIFVSWIVVCLGTLVGVGIKSTRPKIIEIRLKNGGIINCIVIQDGNIVVVGSFNLIIVVGFLDNIMVGFGWIENIFGKVFIRRPIRHLLPKNPRQTCSVAIRKVGLRL